MASTTELATVVGVTVACEAIGVARASFYRHERGHGTEVAAPPAPSPRDEGAAGERSEQILPGSSSEPDGIVPPPPALVGSMLTVGTRVHPTYQKPELLARAPNQVWSWDITKLLGPAKWTYFYLYVILDVYSRYAVGWMVAHREHAELAERLIAETLAKQAIPTGQLTLHADRGSSMTSKPVAFLLADLGVTKTHSRPHVSNDDPYSEAQFKTLKYRPGFPDRFASIEETRTFCQDFFRWYNTEHRHSGIGLLPPAVVHDGQAQAAYDARSQVLTAAHAAHPERFVRQAPRPPQLPTAAWINPPKPVSDTPTASEEARQ
jgi:putative transposase